VLLAAVSLIAAGCSADATRFAENPFANRSQPARGDVTGSVSRAPAQYAQTQRVQAQPLPPPTPTYMSAPATRPAVSAPPVQRMAAPQPMPPAVHTNTIVTASAPPPRRASAPQPAPQISAPRSAAPQSASGRVHTVEPGDTLMRLTRLYNRSLSDIARANNLPTNASLHIGQRVVIPGAGGQQTASAMPQTRQPQPAEPARQPQQASRQAPASVVQQNWPSEAPAREEQVASAQSVTPVSHSPQAEQPRPQNSASADRGFRWPARGRVIAGFGPRPNGQRNDGINIAVPQGTPVRAAEDGVVAYAGNELKSYGNLVLIRHDNGYVTAYAHASEITVKRDQKVRRGEVIARAGQTGGVDHPQLHFEVRKGSAPVDPMPFLDRGGSI